MIGSRLSMTQTKKALLCGSSLFIAGLQSSLETAAGLDVRRVEARADLLREQLHVEPPDALILELGSLPGDFCLDLLREFPHLMLIGLDAESNCLLEIDEILVLSSQPAQALSVTDLVNIIHQKESYSKGDKNEQAYPS